MRKATRIRKLEATVAFLTNEVRRYQPAYDTLHTLLELEPGLEKYRIPMPEPRKNSIDLTEEWYYMERLQSGEDGRTWDVKGMKAALAFRRGRDKSRDYSKGGE